MKIITDVRLNIVCNIGARHAYILQATVNFIDEPKKKPYELLEKKKFQIILSLCTKHTYSMHMLRVLEKARKNEGKQPTVYIYIIRCFTVDDPFSHSLITSKNARSKIY